MADTNNNIQEQEQKVKSRLEYLYDKFNVIDPEDYTQEENDEVTFIEEDEGHEYKPISDIAILRWTKDEDKKPDILINSNTFEKIVNHDPTTTKKYTQWMLNKLCNIIKGKKKKAGGKFQEEDVHRFIHEDLDQAYNYLDLFDRHKPKKKFKKLAKNATTLSHINDPSDVNQYDDLSQIFDAVEPFIEADTSNLENLMRRYEEAGEGRIEFKDRFFTVFVPLSQEACTIFKDVANWCNVRTDGEMFDYYTKSIKRPNGNDSKLYILISNETLKGEDKELYQIHFEDRQIKSQKNELGGNADIYGNVIRKSKDIGEYFYKELEGLIQEYQVHVDSRIGSNPYVSILFELGFTEKMSELFNEGEVPFLRFNGTPLKKLPDMSKFKNELFDIMVVNSDLFDIDPAIGELENLKFLVINNTNIRTIPETISNLKGLELLSLVNNDQLKELPFSIEELDPSKGGSLVHLSIDDDFPQKHILRSLLPCVHVGQQIRESELS